MRIITTKQLRDNMAEVIHNLQKGQSVQLSYRHKVVGILQPVATPPQAERRGSAVAVGQFLSSVDFGTIRPALRETTKSFKQEVAALRQNDLSPTSTHLWRSSSSGNIRP